MAYFSNGSEGEAYEAQYCNRCVNQGDCWILGLHFERNYKDCNKPDSILHVLIPRSKPDGIHNEQCVMFRDRSALEPMEDKECCGYCKSDDMAIKHEAWCKRVDREGL